MEDKLEKAEILKTVGQNIKKARLLKGFTQEMFAEKIDKSTNFVSLVERGESGLSLSTLVDICNVLQIEISIIFNGLITTHNNNTNTNDFVKFFPIFNDEDREIVEKLIKYIIDNKLNR